MKLMKFGGSSLDGPERIRNVAKILLRTEGPAIVVLSAIGDTTDELVALNRELREKEREKARDRIQRMEGSYKELVEELFQDRREEMAEALKLVEAHMEHLRAYTRLMITVHEEREILAQGELLSTALMQLYLKAEGASAEILSALDLMRVDEEREPDKDFISRKLREELEGRKERTLQITQGYICRDPFGKISNLKRGGSDFTASLIAAAIDAEMLEIWTDIDGIHNNDPRVVPDTRPIRRMSFEEAAELAYFGAKVLHPSSMRPVREKGIPVHLKNSFEPEAPGTVVDQDPGERVAIRAIAVKNGITALRIRSGRMLMAYGFLKKVFEVFELHRTPIDMITTSEVAVSLTIDDDSALNRIREELEEFASVEVDRDQSIVCVVGDMVYERSGTARRIFNALGDIPVRMISYGGSRNNLSLLIDGKEKEEALKALHKGVFEGTEGHVG